MSGESNMETGDGWYSAGTGQKLCEQSSIIFVAGGIAPMSHEMRKKRGVCLCVWAGGWGVPLDYVIVCVCKWSQNVIRARGNILKCQGVKSHPNRVYLPQAGKAKAQARS